MIRQPIEQQIASFSIQLQTKYTSKHTQRYFMWGCIIAFIVDTIRKFVFSLAMEIIARFIVVGVLVTLLSMCDKVTLKHGLRNFNVIYKMYNAAIGATTVAILNEYWYDDYGYDSPNTACYIVSAFWIIQVILMTTLVSLANDGYNMDIRAKVFYSLLNLFYVGSFLILIIFFYSQPSHNHKKVELLIFGINIHLDVRAIAVSSLLTLVIFLLKQAYNGYKHPNAFSTVILYFPVIGIEQTEFDSQQLQYANDNDINNINITKYHDYQNDTNLREFGDRKKSQHFRINPDADTIETKTVQITKRSDSADRNRSRDDNIIISDHGRDSKQSEDRPAKNIFASFVIGSPGNISSTDGTSTGTESTELQSIGQQTNGDHDQALLSPLIGTQTNKSSINMDAYSSPSSVSGYIDSSTSNMTFDINNKIHKHTHGIVAPDLNLGLMDSSINPSHKDTFDIIDTTAEKSPVYINKEYSWWFLVFYTLFKYDLQTSLKYNKFVLTNRILHFFLASFLLLYVANSFMEGQGYGCHWTVLDALSKGLVMCTLVFAFLMMNVDWCIHALKTHFSIYWRMYDTFVTRICQIAIVYNHELCGSNTSDSGYVLAMFTIGWEMIFFVGFTTINFSIVQAMVNLHFVFQFSCVVLAMIVYFSITFAHLTSPEVTIIGFELFGTRLYSVDFNDYSAFKAADVCLWIGWQLFVMWRHRDCVRIRNANRKWIVVTENDSQ